MLLCNKTYIGETGRLFITCKKEHRKELRRKHQEYLSKRTSRSGELTISLSDRCKGENHAMDCEKAKDFGLESNKHHRRIREATEIQKQARRTVNRNEGAYKLFPKSYQTAGDVVVLSNKTG